MSVKDVKVEEKEQLVCDVVFASEFRNKETGKRIEESTDPFPDLSSYVKVHEFEEGTILTDAILAKVKSGDIVKVLQMEFVVNNKVNESPRCITGQMLGAVTSSSISVITLNWVKGSELEPTLTTITIPSENEQEPVSAGTEE